MAASFPAVTANGTLGGFVACKARSLHMGGRYQIKKDRSIKIKLIATVPAIRSTERCLLQLYSYRNYFDLVQELSISL